MSVPFLTSNLIVRAATGLCCRWGRTADALKDKLYDNYDDYRKEIAPVEMVDIDDESRFLFGIGAAVTYKTFQSGVWAMSDFTYSRTSTETAR